MIAEMTKMQPPATITWLDVGKDEKAQNRKSRKPAYA